MSGLVDLINLKREHLQRLANTNGAAGELAALSVTRHFVPRPRGGELRNLLSALQDEGIRIRKSSFDAIALPDGQQVDFQDKVEVKRALPQLTFVEIKTANQTRVRPDFSGFFFALTEGEIEAAEALGPRHRVLLLNKATGAVLMTSVAEILSRARSTNWQVSVQL